MTFLYINLLHTQWQVEELSEVEVDPQILHASHNGPKVKIVMGMHACSYSYIASYGTYAYRIKP